MATTQSNSPSNSTQFFVRPVPAPAQTTSLVEQQLRLSVESPQLLAAIEILLPLAKEQYRQLSGPRSSVCDPRIAELIKNEADAWAIGITLAEDSLERIKPYSRLLLRYFHRFETAIRAKMATTATSNRSSESFVDNGRVRSWQCFVGLHHECDWPNAQSQKAVETTPCVCPCHDEIGGAQ